MDVYEFHEYQAIDQPLTPPHMATLQAYPKPRNSGTLTSTQWILEDRGLAYSDLPDWLMDRFFDAHLYTANWGVRIFELRIPPKLPGEEHIESFLFHTRLALRDGTNSRILRFWQSDVKEHGTVKGGGLLDALLPLRDALRGGDLRALYVGWLAAVTGGEGIVYQAGDYRDDRGAATLLDSVEPPLPPGLNDGDPAIAALATFLALDPAMLAAAAENSVPPTGMVSQGGSSRFGGLFHHGPHKPPRRTVRQLAQAANLQQARG